MGYSRSKNVVKKIQPMLEILREAMDKGAKNVKLPTTNPNELAYAIRNALSVAREYPSEFGKYVAIGNTFKISQERDYVVASRRTLVLTGDPVIELAKSLERISCDDVHNVFEVVGAIMEYKAPELEFPAALLTDEEMDSIKTFCRESGHEIINFNPLTVRKNSGGTDGDNATERGVINS
jgi:hypothetical protein